MNSQPTVDLNCDMGESFGSYHLGHDEEMLRYITSANVACGYHAGDPAVMRRTIKMALAQGVAVGAHPGLPDRVGFGRRAMAVSPEEVYAMVVYQVGALWAFVQAAGGELHHVKPHGALYNMAAVNAALAEAVAEAVYDVQPHAVLYGLSGSELIKAGKKIGLATANEVFADRTYQQDGTLTPRTSPDAVVTDQAEALLQVLRMVREGTVRSQQGVDVVLQADTVCIHGDGSNALPFARHIQEVLLSEGILLQATGGAGR